jgi:O-antigen ligase
MEGEPTDMLEASPTHSPAIKFDEIAHNSFARVLSAALLGTFIIIAIWSWLLVFGSDAIEQAQSMSKKFILIKGSGIIAAVLIISSVVAVGLWSYLLFYQKHLFFFLMVASFACSEVLIAHLNEISFSIRYMSIIVIISLGICEILPRIKDGLDTLHLLSFIYLSWLVANLFINGFDAQSIAMLPMQFMMCIGIFFGLRSIFYNEKDIRFICNALAWVGLAMTILHVGALLILPQAFLAGRFRSFYLLPTNFANSYALLFVSMLWLGLKETNYLRSAFYWALISAGFLLLFASGTRNAMIMISVSLSLYLIFWKKLAHFFLTLIFGLILCIVYFLFSDSQLVASLTERLTTFSTRNRIGAWELSWKFIQARPIMGYGLGKEIETLSKSVPNWELLNAHNVYLGIWMQLGIIGLILLICFYLGTIFIGLKLLFSNIFNKLSKDIIIFPLTILIALAIGGLFEENLVSRSSVHQLVWSLSIFVLFTIERKATFDSFDCK